MVQSNLIFIILSIGQSVSLQTKSGHYLQAKRINEMVVDKSNMQICMYEPRLHRRLFFWFEMRSPLHMNVASAMLNDPEMKN
jgi:hypothetical protein